MAKIPTILALASSKEGSVAITDTSFSSKTLPSINPATIFNLSLVFENLVKILAVEIGSEEIEALETHNFPDIQTIFWRNSKLNFNNKVSLLKSLEERPHKDWLKRISECQDEKVLKYFLKEAQN